MIHLVEFNINLFVQFKLCLQTDLELIIFLAFNLINRWWKPVLAIYLSIPLGRPFRPLEFNDNKLASSFQSRKWNPLTNCCQHVPDKTRMTLTFDHMHKRMNILLIRWNDKWLSKSQKAIKHQTCSNQWDFSGRKLHRIIVHRLLQMD